MALWRGDPRSTRTRVIGTAFLNSPCSTTVLHACHVSGSLVVGVLEVGGLICGVPIEAVRFEVIAACRARVGVPTIAWTASLLFGLKSISVLWPAR